MNFEIREKILDRRMLAFKKNLIDRRILFFDMVNSRNLLSKRNEIQIRLFNFLNNLKNNYSNSITNFSITEHLKEYKKALYMYEYYCGVYGDAAIINLTENANIDNITKELQQISNMRLAIGYYISNNDFYTPDDEFYLLESKYFKHQMIIGKINDTKPTDNQIEEYCRLNSKHIRKLNI